MIAIILKTAIWIASVLLFCYLAQYLEKERNKKLNLIIGPDGYYIKLVRRFMPRLIVHDLVGVQPMSCNDVKHAFRMLYIPSPQQLELFPIQPWEQFLIDDREYKETHSNRHSLSSRDIEDDAPLQLSLFKQYLTVF